MNITINRRTLLSALLEVAPFAPQKPAIQILRYSRVTTKGNRIKIEATDSSVCALRYIMADSIDEDNSFLIDATQLAKFLSKLKDDTVTISVNGQQMIIKYARGKGEFGVNDAEIYPAYDMVKNDGKMLTVSASVLTRFIRTARNFVSEDKIRPVLTSIYAYTENGDFGICATDTHKLIVNSTPVGATEDMNWYIPNGVISGLLNLCKNAENVDIYVSDNNVKFRAGDSILIATQPKGNFPNFKRVIPKDFNIECVVENKDLKDCIGRVSLFSNGATSLIKLNINQLDMTISTDDLEQSKSGLESVPHEGCNGEILIGVNSYHLTDCLNAVTSDKVQLLMTDSARPIVVKSPEEPNLTALVMPMVIQN